MQHYCQAIGATPVTKWRALHHFAQKSGKFKIFIASVRNNPMENSLWNCTGAVGGAVCVVSYRPRTKIRKAVFKLLKCTQSCWLCLAKGQKQNPPRFLASSRPQPEQRPPASSRKLLCQRPCCLLPSHGASSTALLCSIKKCHSQV